MFEMFIINFGRLYRVFKNVVFSSSGVRRYQGFVPKYFAVWVGVFLHLRVE